MRGPNLDPTAGERARAINAQPAAFHPIVDPTDPRHRDRESSRAQPRATGGANPIFDPTNPDYGQQSG
jgi:hypothetical protein